MFGCPAVARAALLTLAAACALGAPAAQAAGKDELKLRLPVADISLSPTGVSVQLPGSNGTPAIEVGGTALPGTGAGTTPTRPTVPGTPGTPAVPATTDPAAQQPLPAADDPVLAATGSGPGKPAGSAYDPGPERYGIAIQRDVVITMRDGIKLRADIYRPTDPATGAVAPGDFPIILSTTPYGKQLSQLTPQAAELTGYEPALIKRGYVQVIVDVRGAGASEGVFDLFSPTEQKDAVEIVDFVSKLPGTNGKVGMLGHSYVGITQLLAAGNVGPNSPLKAIFPIMATNDPYRELITEGGLFNLTSIPAYASLVIAATTLNPTAQLPRDPVDAIKLTGGHGLGSTYWAASTLGPGLAGGPTGYDEEYWRLRSPGAMLDRIVDNGVAAYLVGGAYDVFQTGEVLNFVGLQNAAAGRSPDGPLQTKQPLSGRYQLTVGPWYHSANFAQWNIQHAELAWYDRWLKGIDTGVDRTTQPLHVIEAGGAEYTAGALPLAGAKSTKLYLGSDRELTTSKPSSRTGSDRLTFSAAGVTCSRALEQWSTGLPNQILGQLGAQDPCADRRPGMQRALGQRSYTTEPLGQPLRIAGPATLTLQATSTTRDAEFVVTLQDVDPSGQVVDLTAGALLGSHRAVDDDRSWPGAGGDPLLAWHPHTRAAREPVAKGRLTRFDVSVRPTFATIPAGHRLRVVIATSELPHLVAKPGDLVNLLGGSYDVQRRAGAPSFLQLSTSAG
ncbi:MAG: CocE/NonD family hydrolase [Patulibacter minatonensis]